MKQKKSLFMFVMFIFFFISIHAYAEFIEDKEKDKDEDKKKFKKGEIIVKFKPGVEDHVKENLHKKNGSKKIKEFKSLRIHCIEIKKDLDIEKAIKKYKDDSIVEYAEPNFTLTIQTFPDDELFNELWGLYNTGQIYANGVGYDIDAPDAWDINTGDSEVVVAVIDTGIDYNHEDLANNMWINESEYNGSPGVDDDGNGYVDDIYGIDTCNNDSDPMDDKDHGTHAAGTIGAVGNNTIGVTGVNWNVQLMPLKFLDENGSGYTSDAIECLDYVRLMREQGVNIVTTNNSWGGGSYSQALYDAINNLGDTLFVAAAGNSGRDNNLYPFYPANYNLPNVISVAASNSYEALTYFSNFGTQNVHVCAPGYKILSTVPNNNYQEKSGTSMAAPHVAGLAALIKSHDSNKTGQEIKNLILAGGDLMPDFEAQSNPESFRHHDITITDRRINAYGSLTCTDKQIFKVLGEPISIVAGTEVTISAISINCESSNGPVSATTSDGSSFELLDDGVLPDLYADDGIFTANWTPSSDNVAITLSSPSGDIDVRTVKWKWQSDYTYYGGKKNIAGMVNDQNGHIYAVGQLPGATLIKYDSDNGTIIWEKQYENANYNLSYGYDVAVDYQGYVYVAGRASYESGLFDDDFLIIKYDPSGNLIWAQDYDRGGWEQASGIAVDSMGNIYVTGFSYIENTDRIILTLKYDPSGNLIWEKNYQIEGQRCEASDIKLDTSGNIYIAGWTYSYGDDFLTIKYDPMGNVVWDKIYKGEITDKAQALAVDGQGNVYVTGFSIKVSPDRSNNYTTVKYDASGNLMWIRTYDNGFYGGARGVTTDDNGNVYVTGYNDTLKYNASGTLQWSKSLPGLFNDISVDEDGDVYIGGYYSFACYKFLQPVQNQPPIANVGQIIYDNDNSGEETVTLHSSASSDNDGSIVSYEWKEGDVILGTSENITVSLTVGVHTILLTVTDDNGATDTDTFVIIVKNSTKAS